MFKTDGDGSFDVESEFASVRLRYDEAGNGPRVEIRDRRSGAWRYLDPLVLEALATATDAEIVALVDPSRRWNEAGSPG